MWNGVLGIALVEGQDLPQHGQGDIYVRFRLGDQKYKSKVGHFSIFYLFFNKVFLALSSSLSHTSRRFVMAALHAFCLSPTSPLPSPAGVCQ